MAQTRREFLRCAAGLGGLLLAGAAGPVEPRHTAATGRSALAFFASQQSPDGAWRSDRYAAFRDGDALTPLVLWAAQSVPAALGFGAVLGHGLRWLERLTDVQSRRTEPWTELRYPLFTASYAAQVLAVAGDQGRAGVWADLIERLRTTTALGWPADDPACGAWSDAPVPPRYTQPVPDMLAPNISATALAAQALLAAGRPASAQTARPFIEQCQNFSSSPPNDLDDGGFFFAIDDPIRNKAGVAGRDGAGRQRFHSYGSATCDGLLALHACGVPHDQPRVHAGLEWLRRHTEGLTHGGAWSAGRGPARESLVYYHAQALAAVLGTLKQDVDWADRCRRALAADLSARKSAAGSWQGRAPDSCEDEPLLASAFALRALAHSVYRFALSSAPAPRKAILGAGFGVSAVSGAGV